MTETEQKKSAQTGLAVLAIVVLLSVLGGCCCTPDIRGGDMTPQNDCPLIQAGFATIDQLPKILR